MTTPVSGYIWGIIGAFGVTAGAHRLWSHRSYKATEQMKIILLLAFSIAGQVKYNFIFFIA